MKKRYLLAGLGAAVGAALAVKMARRPRDIDWRDYAGVLPHAENSWFADLDGIRVHYQDAGQEDAPAVVLIHGFCATGFIWADVIEPLADAGLRVIVPDLIGFGFSQKPRWAAYTIDMQARMIVNLLDNLGISRAILVGSSYGGAVAATVALDFADRVDRLVMLDAVINDEARNQPLLKVSELPLVGEILCPLLLDCLPLMRWRLGEVYAPHNRYLMTPERTAGHTRTLRTANSHHAVLTSLRHWHADRIEHDATRIKQPTLIMWGDLDTDVPIRNGEKLHAAIPNSRFVVFRGVGHIPQEECPEEFVAVLADFCGARVENSRDLNQVANYELA
ncbi:MAG: alpha/beta hydrolase [Pyrinomonadaceae bacterium]